MTKKLTGGLLAKKSNSLADKGKPIHLICFQQKSIILNLGLLSENTTGWKIM